jgi:hypothetical protein
LSSIKRKSKKKSDIIFGIETLWMTNKRGYKLGQGLWIIGIGWFSTFSHTRQKEKQQKIQ